MSLYSSRPSHASGLLSKGAALGIALLLPLANAQAEQTIGKSAVIKNTVNASLGNRRLGVPDPVHAGETVSSAVLSHGELLLNDNSKIIVGENSSVTLDDFVVGRGGFTKGTISVAKGALRFISGNSPKGAFSVSTPTSTIGARGTQFDVYVGPGGLTRVLLFGGAVEVCGSGGCKLVTQACDAVQVGTNGAVTDLPFLGSNAASVLSQAFAFSLAFNQRRFQEGWRVGTGACSQRASLENRNGISYPFYTPGEPPTPDPPVIDEEPCRYDC